MPVKGGDYLATEAGDLIRLLVAPENGMLAVFTQERAEGEGVMLVATRLLQCRDNMEWAVRAGHGKIVALRGIGKKDCRMSARHDVTEALLGELAQRVAHGDPASMFSLGCELHKLRQPEAALAAFEKEASRLPGQVRAWHAVAALRLELQLPQGALRACRAALELDPNNADSLFHTGVVLQQLRDYAAAVHAYEQALVRKPDHHGALQNLPHALLHAGAAEKAIDRAEQGISVYRDDAELHYNLGDIHLGFANAALARTAFERVLALKPDFHRARYALSIAIAMEGDVPTAYQERKRALDADPALLHNYRSPLVHDFCQGSNDCSPERVAVIARMAALYNCDWASYGKATELFESLIAGGEDFAPLSAPEFAYLALLLPLSAANRQRLAQQVAQRIDNEAALCSLPRKTDTERQQLTIGYISADFRAHPMAWLLGSMYARHDRNRFNVFAYSVGPCSAGLERTLIESGVDHFRDMHRRPAESIAYRIAADGVDILVDLSGYTLDARPEVLAMRPAPIQVSYLGFLGTQGSRHIDYTLLDRYCMLPEQRKYWDESVAYLSDTSIYCERHVTHATALSRAEYGLPETGWVLCALHMPRKIDPMAFDLWLELLEEIPESVLWLVSQNPAQQQAVIDYAQAKGLQAERLVFASFVDRSEHLARYRHADVFLDTFVFNGHTTVIDALSMGVPVVTLPGDAPCARGGASILRAHGLPELVASSPREYKAIVHQLYVDSAWRKEIRARVMDDTASRLFCPEERVREIETAYEMMWARHQAGLPPADFDVPDIDVPSVARS